MPQRSTSWLAMGPGLFIFILLISQASAVWSTEENYLDNYTGAGAEYKGSDSCVMCHPAYAPENTFTHVSNIDGDPGNSNYGYGCEGCHGPGGNHMGNAAGIIHPLKLDVDGVTDLCSKCHSELRTFDVRTWYLSGHYNADKSCVTCHSGHSDNTKFLLEEDRLDLCYACHAERRAEFSMRSHHPVEEGHLGCEDCHNVHSGEYDFQLLDERDNLCYSCHPDKEGPFVYNHEVSMASGGDGCMTCHFAHGGNADNLLRLPARLCTECHTDKGPGNHFAGTCWSSGCHTQIHGSNTHPLFFD